MSNILTTQIKKDKCLRWPEASPRRINYLCLSGLLSTTVDDATKVAQLQLDVAIDTSQLRTISTEIVDPID